MYYRMNETLEPVQLQDIPAGEKIIAVMSKQEWKNCRDGIENAADAHLDIDDVYTTKAEVSGSALYGSFNIPDRTDLSDKYGFAFLINEKGLFLVDDTLYVKKAVEEIIHTKKWKEPSIERFLYDLIEYIVKGDMVKLEAAEKSLVRLENRILKDAPDTASIILNDMRGDLIDLRRHYAQMVDLIQEFEENENEFFEEPRLRYFRQAEARVERLQGLLTAINDYTVQLRDLVHTQMEAKQNSIMTVLTVVTTIFMPLTLITGWYGMNFTYMPELESKYSYPIVFVVCILIIVLSLVYFRKKKWL